MKIKLTQNGDIRIKTVTVTGCTPYIDCDNKNESIESMFKRAVVKLADDTYALQIYVT